ncbi:WD40 repeat-like protein [Auriscalpium vulgare]|uniref:WD40 repeat-like protein n=1 Tax=Auriscalpium vulgare TaxID=40419 RepID=A0ACB8RQC0_9AGAM|nr:WD40 repeat-like protein [Auriscalpium vulgare]
MHARIAVSLLPAADLQGWLFRADTCFRGGSFFMDTDRLNLAMSQYAIAAIILDDMIPSWKYDLDASQRVCVAQHRGEIDEHLQAILSTLNGENNGRRPRSSEYPNLGIMKRLPDGCGAEGEAYNMSHRGELRQALDQSEGDGLGVARGSGEAHSVIYGGSSALNAPQAAKITAHDVVDSPSWNSAVTPMETEQLDHPYQSGQHQEHPQATQQYVEGGRVQDDGHENREEGGSIRSVGGWRATIWPASPPPSSPPATIFSAASPLNSLEEPYRAMSVDSEISIASLSTVTSHSVSIGKSANSQNSYKMKMNMYHKPPAFQGRNAFMRSVPQPLELVSTLKRPPYFSNIYMASVEMFHELRLCRGHKGVVYSVAFSPDGSRFVSGSGDNTIRIWNTETGQPMGPPLKGHTNYVLSVAFSPDGMRIVSGSSDNSIRIWDAETGQPVGTPLEGHTDSVWSAAFSPDGKRVVSGSRDSTIRIWDAKTWQMVGLPLKGHTGGVESVAFSPDSTRVVSGSSDDTIRIWDAEKGQPVGTPLEGHTGWVMSVAISPDGRRVVSGSTDNTICIWDAETRQPVGTPLVGHTNAVNSVAFSPDSRRVVSGSGDETIRIWDVETGQQVGRQLEGHTDSVLSVAFSPDGTRVVSGSGDRTIRIWNVQPDGEYGH